MIILTYYFTGIEASESESRLSGYKGEMTNLLHSPVTVINKVI